MIVSKLNNQPVLHGQAVGRPFVNAVGHVFPNSSALSENTLAYPDEGRMCFEVASPWKKEVVAVSMLWEELQHLVNLAATLGVKAKAPDAEPSKASSTP